MKLATLLENRTELLQLQQDLLDALPNEADVELVKPNQNNPNINDIYATVRYQNREWSFKPGDRQREVFLLIRNGKTWSGPYDLNWMITTIIDNMSERAYRALIVDEDWRIAQKGVHT